MFKLELGIYLLLKKISRTFQLLKKIYEVLGTGNWLFLAKIVTLKGDPLKALSGPNDSWIEKNALKI